MRLQSHPYGPLLAALQASGRADGRLGWTRSPLRAALSGQAERLAVPGGETQAMRNRHHCRGASSEIASILGTCRQASRNLINPSRRIDVVIVLTRG